MSALHSRLKVSVFKLAAFSVKTGHYLKQFRIYKEEYVKRKMSIKSRTISSFFFSLQDHISIKV